MAITTGSMKIVVTAWFLLWIRGFAGVKAAILDIRPAEKVAADGSAVTLRCSPFLGARYTTVYNIQINRRLFTPHAQTQSLGLIDQAGISPGVGVSVPKYSLSGNFASTSPSQSYFMVAVNDPDCNDQAEYQCLVNGASGPDVIHREQSRNLTVYHNPEHPELIKSDDEMFYDVGDRVQITCRGFVGNPQQYWFWESKYTWDYRFQPITVNITDGQVDPPTSSQCSYYSRTTLNYYVGSNDNGRLIRCYAGSDPEIHNANLTIYLRTSGCDRMFCLPSFLCLMVVLHLIMKILH